MTAMKLLRSARAAGPRLAVILLCGAALGAGPAAAQQTIELPKPQTAGGKPLFDTLKARQSGREFAADKLPLPVVSNLLWAAWGVNRADGRRTAPSASNRQEIEIYLAMADGLYLYEAAPHRLRLVLKEDLRAKAGTQPFVADAPLNLIYVADYSKMATAKPEDRPVWAAADTGFIGQNVYLFCASEGLVTVFRAMVDREALAKAMRLSEHQHITFCQTVGYPKK
jgi:SagB-type dehydrogenase family enzyme